MKLSGWGQYPVLDCRVEHLREGEAYPPCFAAAIPSSPAATAVPTATPRSART